MAYQKSGKVQNSNRPAFYGHWLCV